MPEEPLVPPEDLEMKRLALLARTGLVGTEPEQVFDDLTELAAQICDVPIALIALVDKDREWFKARIGTQRTHIPRAQGFCGHAIRTGGFLVAPDVLNEPHFSNHPSVGQPGGPRFFAGAPLEVAPGLILGTLCVIDVRPRTLTSKQIGALQSLARQAVSQIQLRLRSQQLQQQVERVQQTQSDRDVLFSVVPELLCVATVDGIFKQLNSAWTDVLGWDTQELLSKSVMDLVHPDDRAATLRRISELSTGVRLTAFENRYRCKDGSWRVLQWSAAANAARDMVYGAARDITDRQELERMRREFVSTVSHELRTPLTSIQGALTLLDNGVAGTLGQEASDLIGMANHNCQRLLRLINDLLDLEKIEAGRLTLRIEHLPPNDLLRAAVDELAPLARRSQVELVIDPIPPGSGKEPRIFGDRDRIIQVLVNLGANAVRFSDPGQPVRFVARSVRPGWVRVSVEDVGPGIPPNEVELLFERFQQLDSPDPRRRGGTGLGLAISRSIIEQHGGTLGVETKLGSGSTFWFELDDGTTDLSE